MHNVPLGSDLVVCRVRLEEAVNVLESPAPGCQLGSHVGSIHSLGLRAEEPCPDAGQNREGSEEDERAEPDALDHRGSNESNDEVEEPVGARRNGHTLGTTAGRLNLGSWMSAIL